MLGGVLARRVIKERRDNGPISSRVVFRVICVYLLGFRSRALFWFRVDTCLCVCVYAWGGCVVWVCGVYVCASECVRVCGCVCEKHHDQ